MEHLYNWVFAYNPYHDGGIWVACKVEDLPTIRNDFFSEKGVRSSSYETLVAMIIKAEGSLFTLKQLFT